MWGAQYERSIADILQVQDSLAREIAEHLRLELTPEEERSLVEDRGAP